MKRLLIKILILATLLFMTVKTAAYLCRKELDSFNYLAAIVSKHRLLDASAESTSTSRVIMIGDSSLPFGFDAALAERELKIPVINMGLHAAFGLEFILKEIVSDVKSGDKVVLVMHYYPSDADINDGVVCHALDFYPEMYRRLKFDPFSLEKQKLTCDLKRTRRFILNKMSRSATPADMRRFDYKTWALDENGDFYDNLYVNPEIKFAPGQSKITAFPQKETMNLLQEYRLKYEKLGAKLLIIYPPFPETVYNDNTGVIKEFDRLLRQNAGVGILNSPIDSVFRDDYFFNSDYHLTSKGKSEYTKLIIDLLKGEVNMSR